MRNLQDCQAEVFRRSEKRIKERKKRRSHILMACIPSVLCLIVVGGFLLPNLNMEKSADGCAPETVLEHFYAGYGDVPMDGSFGGSVEVSGNGLSHVYTSAEEVQSILDFIREIEGTPEPIENDKWEGINGSESHSVPLYGATTDDSHENNGYRILIHQGDGTTTEYLLKDCILINQSNGEVFSMSETTYSALKDVLGLSPS